VIACGDRSPVILSRNASAGQPQPIGVRFAAGTDQAVEPGNLCIGHSLAWREGERTSDKAADSGDEDPHEGPDALRRRLARIIRRLPARS